MIHLRQAGDVGEVAAILKDPELFERIAEDGQTPDDCVILFNDGRWNMMIMLDNQPIGVWVLSPLNRVTLSIHCNILKPYREHGKQAAILILEWFINECPDQYQKLNAEISVIYPDVYHFTKGFGFKDEGTNRKSIMKAGVLIDQYRLGITREEVGEFLYGHHCRISC